MGIAKRLNSLYGKSQKGMRVEHRKVLEALTKFAQQPSTPALTTKKQGKKSPW